MPWKTADVEAYIKGLSDNQKTVWVKVANAALTRCEEKGGKNCDASAIRQANAVAKQVAEGERVIFEAIGEAELPAGITSDELGDAIRAALKRTLPSGEGSYFYIRDISADYLVYDQDTPEKTACYRCAYTVDGEGRVTLGEPSEVVRKTVYVPVGEAAKLIERLMGPTGAQQAEIIGILIRSGYDPASVLEALGLPPIRHLGLAPVTLQAQGGAPAPFGRTSEGLREAITAEDKRALTAELKGWSTQDVANMHRRLHQWAAKGNTLANFSKADMIWYHNACAKELSAKAKKADGETTHDSPLTYEASEAVEGVTADELKACKSRVLGRIASRTKKKEAAEVELDSDLVPLAEKSIRADGTADIKIISPGWGSSGYYPAEILERDGPKVFKAGTQMYIDHPTSTEESERPERSLRDLAGELIADARWEVANAAGPGLYAPAQVFKPWQSVVEELAPHIGTSIRALGKTEKGEAEGRTGPIVQELVAAKSVDYVTTPGAGGKVLRLIESARNSIAQGGRDKEENKNMDQLEEVTKARDKALARIKELEKAVETQETELNRLREAKLLREAADMAREALAKTDLPDVSQARLVEALGKSPPLKEGQLDKEAFATVIDEAVKAEVAYLAEVKGTGQIRDMGSTGGADDRKALEKSWKHMHPDWTDAQIRIAVDGR